MNIERAHIEFLVLIDKQSSGQIAELPPEVIDLHLSVAQESFIKTRYGGNNIYKTGDESSQKRTEDLKKITTTVDVNTTKTENIYKVVLPDDYMIFRKARAFVSNTVCPVFLANKLNLVQHDDYSEVINDPFNKSCLLEPIFYFEDDQIYLESDGTFDIPKIRLTYIKYPKNVNIGTYGEDKVEFSLSEHTHREIITMAVTNAIEVIESSRVKTVQLPNSTIE